MKSCPLCRLFMDEVRRGDAVLWACASCQGVWLPGNAADWMLREAVDTIRSVVEQSRTVGTLAFEGLARACPQCRTTNLEPYTAPDSIIGSQYRCPRCSGVWLEPCRDAQLVAAPVQPSAEVEPEVPEQGLVPEAPLPPVQQEPRSAEVPEPATGFYEPPVTNAEDAWQRLEAGNRRFVEGHAIHPNCSLERVIEVADEQTPFAVVVTCSDSRVPPEIIFDRGIGDLFVVRTAGHVLTGTGTAGVLYAVEHLHAPLVVILGHTRCGALRAAMDGDRGEKFMGNLLRALTPAVELAAHMPGSHWDNAVRVHVARTVEQVRNALATHLGLSESGPVRVLGALYDTATGQITLVPDEAGGTPPDTGAPDSQQPPVESGSGDIAAARKPAATAERTDLKAGHEDAPASRPEAPSGAGQLSGYARWCPKCRRGYGPEMSFCTECGVLLVRPAYTIRCSACGRRNPIASDRCFHCGASLHPAWRDTAGVHSGPGIVISAARSRRAEGCAVQGGVLALSFVAGVLILVRRLAAHLLGTGG